MQRYVYGLIIAGMLGVLGLTAFRFLDTRIKVPSEEGTGVVTEEAASSSSVTVVVKSKPSVAEKKKEEPPKELPKQAKLDVPFVAEAPDGLWTGPWKNACEEASMVMVEGFYAGKKTLAVADAKKRMTELFAIQDGIWKSNANSDAARTTKIANDNMGFEAILVESPTVEDVKTEIVAGHPVILPVNGKELGNPNIPFLATGSFYHMLVVIGYDDTTGEFITNDDGDEKAGAGRRYKYEPFMASVHDYVVATKKTNGPARAIFTAPR